MYKVFKILLTLVVSIITLIPIFLSVYKHNHFVDVFSDFENLIGIGNLLLGIVGIIFNLFFILIIFLVPMIIFKGLGLNDEGYAFIKKWGGVILIIIGCISILSIAGVQLRGLKKWNDDTTEVIIKEQGTSPVILEKDYFYFNDSINDWVKINRMEYDAKISINPKSILTYSCERLGYKRYHNNDSHKFIANKPKLKYFLFTEQNEKEITKDEFILYRKRDSLIRYE